MADDDGAGAGFSLDLDDNDGGGGADLDLDDLLTEQERRDAEAAADPAGGAGAEPIKKNRDGGDDPVKKAHDMIVQSQNAEIERLRADINSRRYNTEIEQPAATPPPAFDREKLKQELADQMIADPGGAALRIYEAALKSAEQMVEERYRKSGSGLASLDVDQYRATRAASDPDFKDSLTEFDELVKVAAPGMANLTAEQRKQQLDFLADTAYGRAQKKAKSSNNRERTPPSYSGGSSFTEGTRVPTTYKGEKLNKVQLEILRQARENGITDPKRIKKMLSDSAED